MAHVCAQKPLVQKSWTPGWHHLWVAAMVMRTALCASQAALLLSSCSHTDLARGRGSLTSLPLWTKKYFVAKTAQMVYKAPVNVQNVKNWPLNNKTSVSPDPTSMDVPWHRFWCQMFYIGKFRWESSVCKTPCWFQVKWLMYSGPVGMNHIKTNHVWLWHNWWPFSLLNSPKKQI